MIPQLTVAELKRMRDAGEPVYLVDVRNPDEFAYCRLPDSLLIPLPELPGRVGEVEPPEGALVVVMCHHGVRSLRGAAVLRAAGHETAASLSGPGEGLGLERRTAEQLLRAGLFDRGVEASRAALAAIGMRLPTTRVGALL